ncbi:hypothetical protein D3C85_1354650 [compost metagenome]
MAHLEQILCRPFANRAMVWRHGRQAHPLVPAVNQHTGLANIDGQIVNMRIVDAEQNRRLGVGFIHSREEQLRVTVVFFQCAIAKPNFVRSQSFADPLDHAVVKDIRPLIKRTLRGEDHQAVVQQTSSGHTVHDAQLPRTFQHFGSRFFTGVRLPGQHARNGADRKLRAGGDFSDFESFIHFVISLHLLNEKIFIA